MRVRSWMRSLGIAVLTASAITVAPGWQEDRGTNQSPTNDLAGTELVAELNHSVDAKKAKLGDLVKATLTQDVLSRGRIVIRRGSRLVGHITQVKSRGKDDPESRLGMVFDKAVLKGGGGKIDFMAAVRALAPGIRSDTVDKPDPMLMPQNGSTANSNNTTGAAGSGSGRRTYSPSSGSSPNSASVENQASQAARRASAVPDTGTNWGPDAGVMGGGSRGVFGMPGVHLVSEPGGRGSIISSTSHNVKLDSGTQMVIQINNVAK